MLYVCIYISACVYIKQAHKSPKHISALRCSTSTLTAQALTKQLKHLLKLPVVAPGQLERCRRTIPQRPLPGQNTGTTVPRPARSHGVERDCSGGARQPQRGHIPAAPAHHGEQRSVLSLLCPAPARPSRGRCSAHTRKRNSTESGAISKHHFSGTASPIVTGASCSSKAQPVTCLHRSQHRKEPQKNNLWSTFLAWFVNAGSGNWNSRTGRCSHEEDKKERGYVTPNIAGRKSQTISWNNSKSAAAWEVWEFVLHLNKTKERERRWG